MGKENIAESIFAASSGNDSGFETILKNHDGFLIPLDLVRPQFVSVSTYPRRMWGPLIAEKEQIALVWYADACIDVRLANQDREWAANHPIPFAARYPIIGTENFSSEELDLLTSEHPEAFAEDTERLAAFFQRYKEDTQFRHVFSAIVTKACQEIDRLLT